MTRAIVVGLAIVAAVALLLIGRYSVPQLDPETIARADSLADSKKGFDDERVRRISASDSLVLLARQRDSVADAAQAEAARLRAVGARHRTRADGLGVALASAQNAADSAPILVEQVGALSLALDTAEAAADSFKAELGRSREDVRRLILAVDVLRDQVRADSVRLEIQGGVIAQLRKAHSGCRVPLTDAKCPTLSVSYDASEGGLMASAVYPITSLIGVGVSYRLVR